MEAIFSCLSLKYDDGFLPYSMPEVLQVLHGLTDIIIAWAEFKPVLHPEFFGQNGTHIYWLLEWNWMPFTMSGGLCQKSL